MRTIHLLTLVTLTACARIIPQDDPSPILIDTDPDTLAETDAADTEATADTDEPAPVVPPTPTDRDGDGETSVTDGGTDCDDTNPDIRARRSERCGDGIDNNCDGAVDDDGIGALAFFDDRDGDGFGDADTLATACTAPAGTSAWPTDCNDADATVHPNATETCDGLDQDCDGTPDDGAPATLWYADADRDGHGDPRTSLFTCQPPAGWAPTADDCDDTRADTAPGAPEVWYDGVDQDCAGGDDFDADLDGHRAPLDCNDRVATIFPGAPEVWYDGIDQDCDPATEYDRDGDGLTPSGSPVGTRNDCDDNDASALAPQLWYLDRDGDNFGDPATASWLCARPVTGVTRAGDCQDNNPQIGPHAVEICDNIDQDCDGQVDDNAGLPYHPDADRDGHGDANALPTLFCRQPAGWLPSATDCDDADPTISPAGTERCDALDNDCDGRVDRRINSQSHVCSAFADVFQSNSSVYLATPLPMSFDEASDWCGDAGYHLVWAEAPTELRVARQALNVWTDDVWTGIRNDCDGNDPLAWCFYDDADGSYVPLDNPAYWGLPVPNPGWAGQAPALRVTYAPASSLQVVWDFWDTRTERAVVCERELP